MLVPTSDIGSPAALAAGVILLAVFTSVLLARAAHRAQRDGSRRQAGELFGALGRRLAGRMSGKALREAVRDAESEHFWDATEAITTNLRHSERLELARALEHNRHAAAE